MIKLKIFATVCLAVLSSYTFAQKKLFFDVKGKEIMGPDGQPFLMKGTNLGNWLIPEGYMFKFKSATAPRQINETISQLIGPAEAKIFWQKYLNAYITKDDIHFLKEKGVNSIRIPFHYKLFTNEEYLGTADENRGFKLLDKIIGWCAEEEIYVILDMHCAPGGQTGDNIDDSYGDAFLYESEADQQLTLAIWKRIAAKYANNKTVIGYDLLNEPISTRIDTARLNPYLVPLYKRITQAIRMVDKNHLLFLGGAQWDSNFKVFDAPFDSKLVYTFHKYWTAATQDVIQEYLNYSKKYNVPLYMGESGENNDDWVKEFRLLLDKNRIGWHFWPYKKMENEAGMVDFKKPLYYDDIIAFADAKRSSYTEIREAYPKSRKHVKIALDGFLENCLFKNCEPKMGYIHALGLK